jgi:hypothetical protein
VLSYDCSPEAVATYRADLSRDLEERQREAIGEGGGAVVELGLTDEEELYARDLEQDLDAGEPEETGSAAEAAAGASVLQMAGRRRA